MTRDAHKPAADPSAGDPPADALPLYAQLKERLFAAVLDGTYPDGSFLPTEEQLVRDFSMSRVTVRRALQALKDDGVLSSVQGQGTRVSFRNAGHQGGLKIIALVASIDNPFFTQFMRRFETVAESQGALVVLKTDHSPDTFHSDALFERLIRHGIRDMVLWPLTSDLDPDRYARIRAVGVNLVVFDQELRAPWADVVCLDNRWAMREMVQALRARGCRRIALVHYEDMVTPSSEARLAAFRELTGVASDGGPGGPDGTVLTVPWEGDRQAQAAELIETARASGRQPDGWICINGDIGLALVRALAAKSSGKPPPVACIDWVPEMAGFDMVAIEQPLDLLAKTTFDCLKRQNAQATHWRAKLHALPGRVVVSNPTLRMPPRK